MILSVTDLPDEIISLIYCYLPLLDSYNFSRICKSIFYKNYYNNEDRIPNFDMVLMFRTVENSHLPSIQLRKKCHKIRENLSRKTEIINVTDFNIFKCPDFKRIITPARASLDKIIDGHSVNRRDSEILSLVGPGSFDLNLVNWDFEIDDDDSDTAISRNVDDDVAISQHDAETSTLVQLISCRSVMNSVKGRNMFTIKEPTTLLAKLLKNTTRLSRTLDLYDWENIALVERIEKHWSMNIDFDKCKITEKLIYRSNNGSENEIDEDDENFDNDRDEDISNDEENTVPSNTTNDRNIDNESYNSQDDNSNNELRDNSSEDMETEGVETYKQNEFEISRLKYLEFISATFENYIVLFTSIGTKPNVISCYMVNDHDESESESGSISEPISESDKESTLIWENKFIDNQQLELSAGFTSSIKVSGHFVFVSFEDNDSPETIGYYVFSLETGKLLGSFKLKPDDKELNDMGYAYERSEISILGTHIFLDRYFYQDNGIGEYPSWYQLLSMPVESFISQLDTKCIHSEIVITTTFQDQSYTSSKNHLLESMHMHRISTKTESKYRADNFEESGWKIIFQTPPIRDLRRTLDYEEITCLDIIPYFWGNIIALLILYEVDDPRYPEDELEFLFLCDTVSGERKYIEFGYWDRNVHGGIMLVDDRMNFVMLGDGFVEVPLGIEDIDVDTEDITNDRRIHVA